MAAPRVDLSSLAFGRGRLAELLANKVALRSTKDFSRVVDYPTSAPRAVTAVPGGALVVLGATSTLRFEPGHDKPDLFARVSIFPGDFPFPDRENPRLFWVGYGSTGAIFHYALEETKFSFLGIEAQYELPHFDHGLIAVERGGAFVYTTANGLGRFAPHGKKLEFERKVPRKPWRILPARAIDTVWEVSEAGEVSLVGLVPGLPVRESFKLPLPPEAALASPEALAFVVADETTGAARKWQLLVFDGAGKQKLAVPLQADAAGSDESWVRDVTRNIGLALSDFEPLVAVGGPDRVNVWNYRSATQVFSR